MYAKISPTCIEFHDIGIIPEDKWKLLLDELKAAPVDRYGFVGDRTRTSNLGNGMVVSVNRSSGLRDNEIEKILERHGISAK